MLYRDDEAAAEALRLVTAHGYDRVVVTPGLRNEIMARNGIHFAQFRPSRPEACLTDGRARDTARDTAALTMDDIEGARRELAAMNPLLDVGDIEALELSYSGGERDAQSRAAALVELAQMTPSELSGAVVGLAADISQADRLAAAKRGHALKDGSYPILRKGRGPGSLHSAAVLAASGHGDVAAARKLIMKMAHHFGVDIDTLPGFSRDNEDLKEQAERERRRRRHHGNHPGGSSAGDDDWGTGSGVDTGGPSGGGGVSASHALMRRADGSLATIELTAGQEDQLGLAAGYDPGPVGDYLTLAQAQFGTAPPDGGVNSGDSVRNYGGFDIHDVGSTSDGESITDVEAEISRYLAQARSQAGRYQASALSREKPYGASVSYGPRSPAARRAAEERALAGGRPQDWR